MNYYCDDCSHGDYEERVEQFLEFVEWPSSL